MTSTVIRDGLKVRAFDRAHSFLGHLLSCVCFQMSTTSMLNKISAAAAHLLVLQATDDDVSIQEKAVVQANALVAHATLTR